MSNSGVNTGFAKCFIFFMAVVILLQGIVYLGLSVWGLTLKDCSNKTTDISRKPFQFAMDLIYFLDEDCGNPSVNVPDMAEPIILEVNFIKAEPVENRTYIFLIVYGIISIFWIVTSLAVITSLCGPITKTVNGLCFWPWFLIVIAGSILDAVATGYHIYDIINTTSVVKTFNYLSITTNKNAVESLSNFDAYFVTPAVVMTCMSSRVVLIWLLNIFGSSFCLSLSNALSKRNSSKQGSTASLATTSTTPVTNLQHNPSKEVSTEETQQQPEPVLPCLSIQDAQGQLPTTPKTNQQNKSCNVQSSPNSYPTAPFSNEAQANNDYHKTGAYPNRLNYSPKFNTSQHQQELSPITPLNNRYSTNYESFQFPVQNQRVSDELRGQLPWSYTSMPPPMSKKPQAQVYPDIPTPDYSH